MSNSPPLTPEVIQAALKDGIQAIGVEFQASCNPLRVALGVILTNHPDAVFELMNTGIGKVFSTERPAPGRLHRYRLTPAPRFTHHPHVV